MSGFEELSEQLQEELAPYRNQLQSLRQAVQTELENMEVDLPTPPEGETRGVMATIRRGRR